MIEASAHRRDIWKDKTEFVPGVDPRLDDRLVRGEDPNDYAYADLRPKES